MASNRKHDLLHARIKDEKGINFSKNPTKYGPISTSLIFYIFKKLKSEIKLTRAYVSYFNMNINSFHNIVWGGKSVPYGPSKKSISFIFLSRIYDLGLWFGAYAWEL